LGISLPSLSLLTCRPDLGQYFILMITKRLFIIITTTGTVSLFEKQEGKYFHFPHGNLGNA